MKLVEDRLEASLKTDAMDGSAEEKFVLRGQIQEAIGELHRLRAITDVAATTMARHAELLNQIKKAQKKSPGETKTSSSS